MIFKIDKNNSKAIIQLNDNEIEIIKKNNNQIIINAEELPHFRNHLMNVVVSLSKFDKNDFIESRGDEIFHPEDLTKK